MTRTQGLSGRPTLSDVARLAGVSTAAASKALNHRKDVSRSTHERVIAAATDLGYVGRSGIGVSPQIAFVADTFSSLYTAQVLAGACIEAAAQGIYLNTTHLEVDGDSENVPLTPTWLRSIAKTHIGLIVVTTPLSGALRSTCSRLGLPLVAVDPTTAPRDSLVTIGATNWNASMEATELLISLGHRRIAFVGGPETSVPSFERYQGYLSALKAHDVPHASNLVRWSDFCFPGGVSAGDSLLSLRPEERPTGFICASDWIALGVMDAARRRGMEIPGDISIIGFDDTEIASTSTPRMTVVRQPMRELGSTAVRAILTLQSRPDAMSPMRLATELIVRETTGSVPARVPPDSSVDSTRMAPPSNLPVG